MQTKRALLWKFENNFLCKCKNGLHLAFAISFMFELKMSFTI